ncbi:MAG: hypothetical protein K2X69_04825 [Silvanigrellaceae bacterium]|nr:hypothetical protein [Silvanigrellaceae bacterium]
MTTARDLDQNIIAISKVLLSNNLPSDVIVLILDHLESIKTQTNKEINKREKAVFALVDDAYTTEEDKESNKKNYAKLATVFNTNQNYTAREISEVFKLPKQSVYKLMDKVGVKRVKRVGQPSFYAGADIKAAF